MTLFKCGCDVDNNALTLCSNCFDDYRSFGVVKHDKKEVKRATHWR